MTICRPDGRLWFRHALSEDDCHLIEEICGSSSGVRQRYSDPSVIKSLWELVPALSQLTKQVLPGGHPVRAVYFGKDEKSDWSLPWHQDRVIATAEKYEIPQYQNWSCKDGIWHCEPPVELLSRMIVLRIHLDAQGSDEGAMEIAVGSHTVGKVKASSAAQIANQFPREINIAKRGDVMAMDALTLHRSGRNRSGTARRTIRIDLSSDKLPSPMLWAYR